ncbi:MAG: hypothetical protein AB2A00_39335 [Myxococcota bacterium]
MFVLMLRALLLLTVLLTAACDDGRPDRAPFLCCVLTCNGGQMKAEKQAPTRRDAGFLCERGQPINYDGTCSTDDGLECEREDDQEETQGNPDGGG